MIELLWMLLAQTTIDDPDRFLSFRWVVDPVSLAWSLLRSYGLVFASVLGVVLGLASVMWGIKLAMAYRRAGRHYDAHGRLISGPWHDYDRKHGR